MFMNLQRGDEHQLVQCIESVQMVNWSRVANFAARNGPIVPHNVANGTDVDLAFEFVNNDVGKKLQLTISRMGIKAYILLNVVDV
ncbi:hypothetical protein DdX_20757 [Ditylenchus destructor]|uniref:Uncharacterized protein n=1 Tax=Ditylenchus destructor TaxID=166010 RepID=A0AAD4QTF6_9BILA|nr:hypothetical protein DdX_20757 [Ditylenchus destructor]